MPMGRPSSYQCSLGDGSPCDKPFDEIEDIIERDELELIANNYKTIAGFDLTSLET